MNGKCIIATPSITLNLAFFVSTCPRVSSNILAKCVATIFHKKYRGHIVEQLFGKGKALVKKIISTYGQKKSWIRTVKAEHAIKPVERRSIQMMGSSRV